MKCVRTQSMTPNRVLQVFDKKTNHFHKQLIARALIMFTMSRNQTITEDVSG